MKIGTVILNEGGLMPMVSVEFKGTQERWISVDALLDSGFTGAVSLPIRMVENLQLKWSGKHWVTLGDASEVPVDLYEGFVDFADRQYRCAVLATGDVPTVGMHLIQGFKVCFESVEGGDIEIETSDD